MKANDAIAFERSIFSENQDYKSFLHVTMNPYTYIYNLGFCVCVVVAEN